MTDQPLAPGRDNPASIYYKGGALPIGETSDTPTDPQPDQSPCEAILATMICDLETDLCCLTEPSGDPVADAVNAAHQKTAIIQLAILYEALDAIKSVYL